MFTTKDSGVREKMETGSQRDSREGKGRYDLISPFTLKRLAAVFERGASKYDERNWELGQKQLRYFDSAVRHLMNWIEGMEDEDHLAQAMWNVGCMVHQDELIRRGVTRYLGLDDRPTYWRETNEQNLSSSDNVADAVGEGIKSAGEQSSTSPRPRNDWIGAYYGVDPVTWLERCKKQLGDTPSNMAIFQGVAEGAV